MHLLFPSISQKAVLLGSQLERGQSRQIHTHFLFSVIVWCIMQYIDVSSSKSYSADKIQLYIGQLTYLRCHSGKHMEYLASSLIAKMTKKSFETLQHKGLQKCRRLLKLLVRIIALLTLFIKACKNKMGETICHKYVIRNQRCSPIQLIPFFFVLTIRYILFLNVPNHRLRIPVQ